MVHKQGHMQYYQEQKLIYDIKSEIDFIGPSMKFQYNNLLVYIHYKVIVAILQRRHKVGSAQIISSCL